jgi:hypothetical protein
MPPRPTIKLDGRLLNIYQENPWLAKIGEEFQIMQDEILVTGGVAILKQNYWFVIFQKPESDNQIYGRIVRIKVKDANIDHHFHEGVPFITSDINA